MEDNLKNRNSERSETPSGRDSEPRYFFLEVTNHCNFNCTFCPDGIMERRRRFMDKKLLFRLIDEIAGRSGVKEPVQLHAMGEPLLYPHLFEAIGRLHKRGLQVRLFTNGALLNEKYRGRIFDARPLELVIGIHTFNKKLYDGHRRGKPPFDIYMDGIYGTIKEKFARNSEKEHPACSA
jgi:MoaA/NifB/PqqE/SkfB family radical SAM enzyme